MAMRKESRARAAPPAQNLSPDAREELLHHDVRLRGRQALAVGQRVGDQHRRARIGRDHPHAPVLADRQLKRQGRAQRRQHLPRPNALGMSMSNSRYPLCAALC